MRLSVRTQDERTWHVDVAPTALVRDIKTKIQAQDGQVLADRFRLLFQGRFLADDETAHTAGLGEGHTLLLVPKPANVEGGRGHRRVSSTGGPHGAPRVPPEVLRFLQAQQQIFALLQSQRGRGDASGSSDRSQFASGDEELGRVGLEGGFELESATVEVRDGDQGDLVLGFAFGFLLGPMAGLCLIESSLSRRLRTGMLVGIVCEVIFCLSKMAASVPKGY